jgi:hypothetical protein
MEAKLNRHNSISKLNAHLYQVIENLNGRELATPKLLTTRKLNQTLNDNIPKECSGSGIHLIFRNTLILIVDPQNHREYKPIARQTSKVHSSERADPGSHDL